MSLSSKIVLVNVYDVMIKSVGVVPRVETKLYSEWVSVIIITASIYKLFVPMFTL